MLLSEKIETVVNDVIKQATDATIVLKSVQSELTDRLAVAIREQMDVEALLLLEGACYECQKHLTAWRQTPEYVERVAAKIEELHKRRAP